MRCVRLPPSIALLLLSTGGCFREKPEYVPPPPNAPPSAPTVSLGPTGARTADDLVVTIVAPSVDPEGSTVAYSYAWFQGSIPRAEFTGDTLPATETSKGQIWRVVVTPNDGEDDGEPGTAEITVANTAPEATVTLSPGAPTNADDIRAEVERSDVDGDPVSVRYAWTVDGVATDYDTDTIRGAATEHGQVWAVTVTPFDADDSGVVATAEVRVENTLPTMRSVSVSPVAPYVTDDLVAEASGRDDDGDALAYTYRWIADGAEVQSGASDTLAAGSFTKNQQIYVEVTPNDGFGQGEPLASDIVVSLNSMPSGASVAIGPDPAYEASTMTCVPTGFTDADGDPETWSYAWSVNGVAVATTETLDGAAFDEGDRVTCRATPSDGEETGPSLLSRALTVSNTPPAISSVALSTYTPDENDTLTVTIVGASDDDDDSISYRYAWYVAGVEVSTSASLGATRFALGDSIYVVVTPYDGEDTGTPVASPVAVGANTPPTLTSVTLTPDDPATNSTLTARATASDVDGDSVSFHYQWFVDGVSLGAAHSSSTLDGATAFDRGQEVYVVATPNDGVDDGAPASSDAVVVVNTPPTAPGIAISPAGPEDGDDLTCAIVTDSSDPDGDPVAYSFAWDVDGAEYTAATDSSTNSIVAGSDVGADERWTCEVSTSDGIAAGGVADVDVLVADGEPAWTLAASWPLTSQPSGSTASNGAYGGQAPATVGGASCWNQTSDWNYLWIPHPDPSANRMRVEVDVYANTASTWGFTVSPLVDGPAYIPDTYVRNGVGFGSGGIWYTIGYTGTTVYSFGTDLQTPYAWFTVRQDVDFVDGTTTVYKDGVEVGSGAVSAAAAVGSNLLLNSGVPFAGSHCFKNLLFYTAP